MEEEKPLEAAEKYVLVRIDGKGNNIIKQLAAERKTQQYYNYYVSHKIQETCTPLAVVAGGPLFKAPSHLLKKKRKSLPSWYTTFSCGPNTMAPFSIGLIFN